MAVFIISFLDPFITGRILKFLFFNVFNHFSFLLIYFHFIGKAMSNLMVFLLGCAPELAMELFKNRHAWTSPPGHFNLIGLDCGRGIYVFKKLPGGSEA